MENEENFTWVKGKVPKRDKDGNDITGDKLAPGGYRRDDGTLSGMAYDLKALDDDDDRSTEYVYPQDPQYEMTPENGSDSLTKALSEVIGTAIVVVGPIVVAKTVPYIKDWWVDKALPNLKRERVRKEEQASPASSRDNSQAANTELIASNKNASAEFSKAIDVALEEHGISMSSAEAQKRLIAMLAAAAFIAQQKKILSNARIENNSNFLELKSAMEDLTGQQITEIVNLMLETNAFLLDEETSNEFVKILGGGQIVDGKYVPLRNEKTKKAWRTKNGEMPSLQKSSDVEEPNEDTTGRI